MQRIKCNFETALLLKSIFSEIRVRVVSRQNNRPLIGRPDRSANQRPAFLAGNYLLDPDSDPRKN